MAVERRQQIHGESKVSETREREGGQSKGRRRGRGRERGAREGNEGQGKGKGKARGEKRKGWAVLSEVPPQQL